MKRLSTMCIGLSILVMAGLLATPVIAQEGGNQGKAMASAQAPTGEKAKDRWEGIVERTNRDKKTLTVRQRSVAAAIKKTVMYDDSTKWESQEHKSKKITVIDATQVNDGDRVICLGSYDKQGVLHATLISKRLTPE
jgi:cytochrome c-type biogenesis protein CcmH/NrfG